MFEHGVREPFDVVGQDVASALDRRIGLGGPEKGHRGARARAKREVGAVASTVDDAQDVVADFLVDEYFAYAGLHPEDGLGVGDRLQARDGMRGAGALEEIGFGDDAGVTDREPEHEAVELGFRKREGAFVLDRVLRGKHQKGLRERVRLAVYGDLAFGHGLEESRLGAWRSAVDFVGDDDLGKNGSPSKLEFLRFLVIDRDASDVGGQQVGRALDPIEGASARDGQRPDEDGLGDSGDVLEQDVAAGDEGGEGVLDDLRLVHDDGLDIIQDIFDRVSEFTHLRKPLSSSDIERLNPCTARGGGGRKVRVRIIPARPNACNFTWNRKSPSDVPNKVA